MPASPRPSTAPTPPPAHARTLALIRVAMLVGVLAFGAIIWWVRRDAIASYAVDPHGLRVAGQVVWGVVTFGVLALFLMAGRVGADRRASFSVIAWALGESAAIYGGVFWLLLGDSQWYLYGVASLLLTYFIFPVRTAR